MAHHLSCTAGFAWPYWPPPAAFATVGNTRSLIPTLPCSAVVQTVGSVIGIIGMAAEKWYIGELVAAALCRTWVRLLRHSSLLA
jgi:hypothetical protein